MDAGALDLLPDHVPGQVVITPHAGEMAALLNRLEVDPLSKTGAPTADDAADDESAGHVADDDAGHDESGTIETEAAGPSAPTNGEDGPDAIAPTLEPAGRPRHAGPSDSSRFTVQDVTSHPLASARRAHELTGATVLLKGAVTIVVDEDHVYVSGSAPAWLATAGAGDVLAGLAGALLAQQGPEITTAETVASAAYLHGMAAAIASESEQQGWQEPELVGHGRRQRFMTLGHPIVAGDVIRAIPEAIADVIA